LPMWKMVQSNIDWGYHVWGWHLTRKVSFIKGSTDLGSKISHLQKCLGTLICSWLSQQEAFCHRVIHKNISLSLEYYFFPKNNYNYDLTQHHLGKFLQYAITTITNWNDNFISLLTSFCLTNYTTPWVTIRKDY